MKLSKLVLPLALTASVLTTGALERRVTELERVQKLHTELFVKAQTVFDALQATDLTGLTAIRAISASNTALAGKVTKNEGRLDKLEGKKAK